MKNIELSIQSDDTITLSFSNKTVEISSKNLNFVVPYSSNEAEKETVNKRPLEKSVKTSPTSQKKKKLEVAKENSDRDSPEQVTLTRPRRKSRNEKSYNVRQMFREMLGDSLSNPTMTEAQASCSRLSTTTSDEEEEDTSNEDENYGKDMAEETDD